MVRVSNFILLFATYIISTQAFTETNYDFTIPENIPINSLIGTIALNKDFTYRFNPSTTSSSLFSINFDSGEIKTIKLIDREMLEEDDIRLIVVSQPSSLITVIVHNMSILESSSVGTRFLLPNAFDKDLGENGEIDEYLLEASEKTMDLPFILHRTSPTEEGDMLFLEINKPLDREKVNFYEMTLIAKGKDKSKTGSIQIFVAIDDANDNIAIFKEANYTFMLTSSLKKGDVIGQVEATDLDLGLNGQVKYLLNSKSFGINKANGEIFAKADKVNCSNECILVVDAMDLSSNPMKARSFVKVRSVDETLYEPQMTFRLYPPNIEFANIMENASVGMTVAVITVQFKGNSEIDLDIVKGNEKGFFTLEKGKSFGIIRVGEGWVKRKRSKKDKYVVEIEAKTLYKNSKKKLEIFVRPAVDEAPVCHQSIVKIKISESHKIGTLITKISAESKKILVFSMMPSSNLSNTFYLHPQSGFLFLASSLNHQKRNSYVIDVNVKNPRPSISSSICRVYVDVLPEITKAPIFDKKLYEFMAREDLEVGKVVGKIKTLEGSKLKYQIIDYNDYFSKWFRIKENSGEIIVKSPLSNLKPTKFSFQVQASDGTLSNSTSVIINIPKSNINKPYFAPSSYYHAIKENAFVDSPLLRVKCVDIDEVDKGKLTYFMAQNEYSNLFELSHLTGLISLKKRINNILGKENSVVLEIGCKDGGGNISDEKATVKFEVVKDDEKLGSFGLLNKFEFALKEDSPINLEVTKMTTIGNGSFELLGCAFLTINEETGSIKLSKKLDYELEPIHYCYIKFGKVSHPLTINVVDVNDNAVHFTNSKDILINLDYHVIGQDVGRLMVEDGDVNDVQFKFDVTNDLLKVDDNGIVRLASDIDVQLNQITGEVVVKDNFGKEPFFEDRRNITVFINHLNKKKLPKRQIILNVEEETKIGTFIGQLPNDFSNKKNTWRSLSNITNNSVASFVNGTIVVTGHINYEANSNFKVIFSDDDEVVEVIVNILDINNNGPICGDQTFSISSSVPIYSKVGKVICTDKDSSKNSVLEYSFINLSGQFNINEFSGEIRSIKKVSGGEYKLDVQVSDKGSLRTKCQILVKVTSNEMDEVKFEKKWYYWDVNKVPSIYVKASNATKASYFIQNDNGKFDINKRTALLTTKANETLVSGMYYNLTIIGQAPNLLPSSTFVLIEPLKPLKLKPIFINLEEQLEIHDTLHPGSIISQVSAIIADPRNPTTHLETILYTISGPSVAEYFEIDLYNGEIKLIKKVTSNKEFKVKVQAVGGNGKIEEKGMVIKCVRDGLSSPLEILTSEIKVTENNRLGTVIGKIQIAGDDFSDNTILKVLFDTSMRNIFVVSGSELIAVEKLDREELSEIKILMELRRGKRSVKKWITVTVMDENDHDPDCDLINSVLVKILPMTIQLPCIDLDYGVNGSIGYKLESDNSDISEQLISMGPNGDLFVDKSFENYQPTVNPINVKFSVYDRAFDELHGRFLHDGTRRQISRKITLIRWRESFDFKFEKKSYLIGLSNLKLGNTIGFVKITEKGLIHIVEQVVDGLSKNELTYFDVSDNGEVKIIRSLPNHVRKVVLKLVAVNSKGYTGDTDLIIVNEKPASYKCNDLEKGIFMSVEEIQKPGTIVGKVLNVDFNEGDLKFEFDSKHELLNKWFFLNETTGLIKTKQLLDYESEQEVYGIVSITSSSQTTKYPISISISNVRNNLPEFVSCPHEYYVREDAPIGSVIGSVQGTDKDGNKLKYSLKSNYTNVIINSESGILSVNGEFDHEKQAFYKMLLQITDNQGSVVECLSYLYIEDVNDNKSFLPNTTTTIQVPEDTTINTKLFTFNVQDEDVDTYFNYQISLLSNPFNLFAINENDNSLYLINSLDYETTKQHTLEITIFDNIYPSIINSIKMTLIIEVVNVNDEKIQFDNVEDYLFIGKSMKKGDIVGAITAVNNNYGGVVQYRINPESLPEAHFLIDPIFGYIYLNVEKIMEEEMSFEVEAYDNQNPKLVAFQRVVAKIEVSHADDVIEIKRLNISIKENTSTGYLLAKLNDSHFGYSSSDYCKYIQSSGSIFLAKDLDYELTKKVECEIKNYEEKIIAIVSINVVDVNDNAPEWIYTFSEILIMENIDKSLIIETFKATDKDSHLSGQVTYSLIDGNQDIFWMNATSGELTIKQSLDRESFDVHELTIAAFDSGFPRLSTNFKTKVSVIDQNDNPPIFDAPLYYLKLEENSKPIDNLITVIAKDKDIGLNGYISYSIISNQYQDFPFSINMKTGQISLVKSLDYEKEQVWNFTVMAEDNGQFNKLNNQVNVIVDVKNVHDNQPVIRNSIVDVFIRDTLKIGDIVYAIDAVSAEKDTLIYSLSGDDATYFAINEDGHILLYSMYPKTQKDFSIVVSVKDSIDNVVSINLSFYLTSKSKFVKVAPLSKSRIALSESEMNENILKVEVLSDDGVYKFTILAGDPYNHFSIDALSGLLTVNKLDREVIKGYNLVIGVAKENSLDHMTYQVLKIHVIDVNEKPQFMLPLYEITVSENNIVPRHLIKVNCEDLDSDLNGQFEYSIVKGNEGNEFSIDKIRGNITIAKMLDAEMADYYKLIVEAKDKGSPSLSDFTIVSVKVDDSENDNGPKFERLLSSEIVENNEIGALLTTIYATDLDKRPENRLNQYYLESDFNETFSLNKKTGELFVMTSLDRETASEYKLKVIAKDDYWQITTTLLVTVKDLNDNMPVFEEDSPSLIKLNRNEKFGDNVGIVKAIDEDEGNNGEVKYFIDGEIDLVYVEADSGRINLLRQMDENENNISVWIKAVDNGNPRKESKLKVNFIKNFQTQNSISSETAMTFPKSHTIFENSNMKLDLWEDTSLNCALMHFTQTDKPLVILKTNCKNKEICENKEVFVIKNNTLYLQKQLDFESERIYQILIGSGSDTMLLDVNIRDTNEFPAIFVEEEVKVEEIGVNSKIGTILTFLPAMDLDDGKAAELNFFLLDTMKIFNISKKQGFVSLIKEKKLKQLKDDFIELEVIVKNGLLKRRSPKKMNIKVKVGGTVPIPIFSNSQYFADVRSNITDSVIINLGPSLSDGFKYLVYPESKQMNGIFCLDSAKGDLSLCKEFLKKKIQLEKGNVKLLAIIVKNGEEKSFATITVNIQEDAKVNSVKRFTYVRNGADKGTNLANLDFKANESVDFVNEEDKNMFTIDKKQKVLKNKETFKRNVQDFYDIPIKISENKSRSRIEHFIINVDGVYKNVSFDSKKIIIQSWPKNISLSMLPSTTDCFMFEHSQKIHLTHCQLQLQKSQQTKSKYEVEQNKLEYQITVSLNQDHPEGVWLKFDTTPFKISKFLEKLQRKMNDMEVRVVGVVKDKEEKLNLFVSIIDTYNKAIDSKECISILEKFMKHLDALIDVRSKFYENDCEEHLIEFNEFIEFGYANYSWYSPMSKVESDCAVQNNDDSSCSKVPLFVNQIFLRHYQTASEGDCLNGGKCLDNYCQCLKGFEGNMCQSDIDECRLNKTLCGTEGKCINLPGSYKCIYKETTESPVINKLYGFTYGSHISTQLKSKEIDSISFDFITNYNDAILLYSFDPQNVNEYFVVDMVDGRIRLSLNRSVTEEIITEFLDVPVNDGLLKRLLIKFTYQNIEVQVLDCSKEVCSACVDNDKCKKIVDTIYGHYSLPSNKLIFGGTGEIEEIRKRKGIVISNMFSGCGTNFKINDEVLPDYEMHLEQILDYCPLTAPKNKCGLDTCGNYGKCQNIWDGFRCNCNGGYDSYDCGEMTYSVSLSGGQLALELSSFAKEQFAFVPIEKDVFAEKQNFVSKIIQKRTLNLSGATKIPHLFIDNQQHLPVFLQNATNERIELDVKTNNTDGVIMSIYSNSNNIIGMIQLINGTVNYGLYNGLTNLVQIVVQKHVSDERWHRITVESFDFGRRLKFQVDGVGREIRLDIPMPPIIHEDLAAILIGAAKSTSFAAYDGCIRRLVVNGMGQNLIMSTKKQATDIFSIKTLGKVDVGCQNKQYTILDDDDCENCMMDIENGIFGSTKETTFIVVASIIIFLILLLLTAIYWLLANCKHPKHKNKANQKPMEENGMSSLNNLPRTFTSYQNPDLTNFSPYASTNNNIAISYSGAHLNHAFSSNSTALQHNNNKFETALHIYDAPSSHSYVEPANLAKNYHYIPTLEMDATHNNSSETLNSSNQGTIKRCRRLLTFSVKEGATNSCPPTALSYYRDEEEEEEDVYAFGRESPYL
uniref:Cadherin domain-containing protein n=1 Tax=Rhabditophanes sp. KR3021 TaxID=114890 RepID=A0AC35UC95_9BILA